MMKYASIILMILILGSCIESEESDPGDFYGDWKITNQEDVIERIDPLALGLIGLSGKADEIVAGSFQIAENEVTLKSRNNTELIAVPYSVLKKEEGTYWFNIDEDSAEFTLKTKNKAILKSNGEIVYKLSRVR